MASIYDTRSIIEELEAVLNANADLDKVSSGALVALAQETLNVAVYIDINSIAMEPVKASTGVSGYDRHLFISLHCNVNIESDAMLIYDIADSIERCVLTDNAIWSKLIDRDFEAITFDNQEHSPKRQFSMLLDIRYKLRCE